MRRVPVLIVVLFGIGGVPPALADVDTLECNSAAAIRVEYGAMPYLSDDLWATFNGGPQSGAFCLMLDGEEVTFEVDGIAFSIRYDAQTAKSSGGNSSTPHLGMLKSITLSPSDRSGAVYMATPMERARYDPVKDGNWRYTPLWMEASEPIRIVVGEHEGGAEL